MTNVYLVSLLLLTVLPVLCIGVLWIAQQYQQFNTLTEKAREDYLLARKQYVRDHVNEIYTQIEQHRSQRAAFIQSTLRTRAVEAHRLLTTLQHSSGNFDQHRQSLLQQAAEVLYPTRFYAESHGQYWLLDLSNESLLLASQRQSADLAGFPMADILAAYQQQEEGYLSFLDASRSEAPAALHSAYFKLFAPLNVLVVTAEPAQATDTALRRWVLNVLQKTRYDIERSMPYVLNAEGEVLAHPAAQAINAAMPETAKLAGASEALLSKHLQAAKNNPEGEFVEFRWQNWKTGNPSHGISFVKAFPEWGWIIGSGFYLDDFDQRVAIQREQLQQAVTRQLAFATVGLLVVLLFAVWLARWLSRRTASGFRQFNQFFKDANRISSYIDKKTLPYSEFSELADQANAMIEERSRFERALLDSEHRFQLALQHAQHYLWDVQVEQRTVSVSPGFFESLGYDSEELDFASLDTVYRLCHPDDLVAIKSEQLLHKIQKSGMEIRLRDSQGQYRWFFARGSRVQPQDGAATSKRLLGIVTEVTQRKKMEEELVNAHIAAEGASYAKSQFLATMSHELRTPLNGVLGYAQLLLQNHSLSKEQRQYIRSIADCGEHLLAMIGDILELSKLSTEGQQMTEQECWLSSLCQSVSDTVAEKARSKGLLYSWRIDDAVPQYIETDTTKLKHILVNLLLNAIKFTPEGWVRLNVYCDSNQQFLLFVVADSGVGIAAEQLQTVFEPFNQLNGAATEGTGLGLALSKRMAEALGGDIVVASELEQGSQFRLRIPLKMLEAPLQPEAESGNVHTLEVARVESLPPAAISQQSVMLDKAVLQPMREAIKQGDVEVLERHLTKLLSNADTPELTTWLQTCLEHLERFDIDAVEQMIAAATKPEAMA